MQFLYFLPGVTKGSVTPTELDAIGLGHVHDGVQPVCTQDVRGPGGVAGMLVAAADPVTPPDAAADPRFVPDAQAWRPGPRAGDADAPKFHVGFWTDRRPTAETLVRKKPLGGTPVRLRDGGDWPVPVAMARAGLMTLPMVMDLTDAGHWVGRVSPEYRHLCDSAKNAYEMLMSVFVGEAGTVKFDDSMAIVVAALAANHRVGPVELAALGLVGDDQIGDVLEAVCSWADFREAMLKRLGEPPAGASSATSSGSPADSPATNPPGPTSGSTP